MLEDFIDIANILQSHFSKGEMAHMSEQDCQSQSDDDHRSCDKKRCACQEFFNRIEIPGLKCVTDFEVFHNGIKELHLHGKEYLSVHYTIEIKYIDDCGCKKVAVQHGNVLFVELPDCFFPNRFVVNIPNPPQIEILCDEVIVRGIVKLCCKHHCHHKSDSDYNSDEWNQHSKHCCFEDCD